jgi:hypothetical protein
LINKCNTKYNLVIITNISDKFITPITLINTTCQNKINTHDFLYRFYVIQSRQMFSKVARESRARV